MKIRSKVEIELENAKLAARNVLEDLQIEKQALAHEKAKDDAMLASIGDGVIIVDPLGKITLMNKSAEDLLGWKSGESVGKMIFDVVPIEDNKGVLISRENHPMSVVFKTGSQTGGGDNFPPEKKILGVYYYIRKDKTKFPVSTSFSLVLLKGKVVGAIEVFRDITKEREMDQGKNEFVSLASHQLRTPLTIINWYSEMLLQDGVENNLEKLKEYLFKIHEGSGRMVVLVNTLLNISRIELGTLVVELEPVQIGELLESVVNEQKQQIEEKKIIVTNNFSSGLPTFKTDSNLLRMVFQNLLSNALKYTPSGGRIDIEVSIAEDKSFLIVFSDTGYGIPKADQDKIFTKMFRADNIKEKVAEGTGLGLYMAKSLLTALGGSIRFESEENKGAHFFINLTPVEV